MGTRLVRLVAAVGVAAIVTACGGTGPAGPAANDGANGGANGEAADGEAITVVASTNVWASVAEAVGGNEVSVKAIVTEPAGDPHSYQVTARDAADLRAAALVVYNGGGYDDFVDQALGGQSEQRRVKAVDLHPDEAGGGEEGHGEEGHGGDGHGHPTAGPNDRIPTTTNGFARGAHETGENEHVWYDLPTVAMVAGEIASQLSQLRPAAKATFVANADAFDAKLDALEAEVNELATAHGGTSVATTEPLAHYLLDAAKLTDATPHEFVDAIEEETDPPAAAVAQMQRLVSERAVTALVHNPQTETPVVADVVAKAREARLPVVELTETLPTGQDYLTWMGGQIDALSAALKQR